MENDGIGVRFMKIAFIGQPEYFRFCYEQDLSGLHEVREFPFTFGMREEDLAALAEFDADVNFFFRGEFFPASLLRRLRGRKVAFSSEPFPRELDGRLVYTRDSWGRYLDFRARMRDQPFDYVFHYDAASLGFMADDGLHLSGSFPFPVATDTYVEQHVEKQWDMFFIGRSTLHREKYFGPLKHHYHFLHICHGVYGPPLLPYIGGAKINLNIHAEPEVSWEPRMQMLLATGAFVISEPITPNPYLRPGIDYVETTSPGDLYEKVTYYLAHDDERRAIAASGHQRVNELLCGSRNFLALIDELENGAHTPYRTGPASRRVEAVAARFRAEASLRSFARKILR